MNRVLLLKRKSDDFDAFLFENVSKSSCVIDVCDPYIFFGKIGRRFVNFAKKIGKGFLFEVCLSLTRKQICRYEQIIVFDDYPDLPLIRWIKTNNPSCRIKLWLWNVPKYPIEEYKNYCDVYCFDKDFCEQNNLHFIEQFYFPEIVKEYQKDEMISNDIVYVGVDKNRKPLLIELTEQFERFAISYDIRLITTDKQDLKLRNHNIQYLRKALAYRDVLKLNVQSKAILEIVNDNQMGLTWRALEALYFKKKLITNNKSIKGYDFYNSKNIFIIGEDSLSNLDVFIENEVIELDNVVLEKYSFEHWLSEIMR